MSVLLVCPLRERGIENILFFDSVLDRVDGIIRVH